jgi:hypothetical protein
VRTLLGKGIALACCFAVAASAAGTASAGTLTHSGFTTDGIDLDGSIYLGIGGDRYGNGWWELSLFENSERPVRVADYATAEVDHEGPGSCADEGRGNLRCGLAPTGGEPFTITGSQFEDHFSEVGCNSTPSFPDYTPCPRVFKVFMGAGNDYIKLWNFSVGLADERDPATGTRPWMASGRAPMPAVEIDAGTGNDVVILAGGPSSGSINAGDGDDQIFTRGGYSEVDERVTGPYSISCGPGYDTVEVGPNDSVGRDCERTITNSDPEPDVTQEQPKQLPGYDMASTCGKARFDFRSVAGELGAVRKGRSGCVFLVSNRVARQLLKMAYNSNGSISDAFTKVLSVAARAAKETNLNSDALEGWIWDQIPVKPDEGDVIQLVAPKFIRRAYETAERANPLFVIGESVGLLAIPLRALLRIDQIETKKACMEFVVGVRSRKAYVESRLVYNPAYFNGKSGTYARVNKREPGFLGSSYPARYLNLACRKNGMVSTTPRRDTPEIFRGAKTVRAAAV